jgi:hypothetical protein
VALPPQKDARANQEKVRQQERPERRVFGIICHSGKIK